MFKKWSVLFLLFTFFIQDSNAQLTGNKYDKLFDLYILGDYEKCIRKAERYTNRDKTKRDPQPYLYLSQCYFAVSRDRELEEYYPRAFKNALKHAYKVYRKGDETTLMEDNADFFTELKQAAIEEAMYNYNLNDFRKAAYYLKKVLKFDPDDHKVQLMCGVAQVRARNRRMGSDNIEEALKGLKATLEREGTIEGVGSDLIGEAMVDYTKYLMEKKRYTEAEDAIADARLLDSENAEVEQLYSEIYSDS